MSSSVPQHSHASEGMGHVVPLRIYYAIFLTLLVLTAVTVAVAYVNLGPLNNIVAMAIAATKATLVLLYFMHLRYSSSLNRMAVVSAILFVALMILVTLSDTFTRAMVLPTPPLASAATSAQTSSAH